MPGNGHNTGIGISSRVGWLWPLLVTDIEGKVLSAGIQSKSRFVSLLLWSNFRVCLKGYCNRATLISIMKPLKLLYQDDEVG